MKIKKHNQLSFGTLVIHHVPIVEITYKIQTSFKTLSSKKVATWHLKKYHSNDELSRKVMSFSYHIE